MKELLSLLCALLAIYVLLLPEDGQERTKAEPGPRPAPPPAPPARK